MTKVKAITLGWMEDLERENKAKGKKRKTFLYWKKLLREGGMDYTNINKLTLKRKEWKKDTVMKRMQHLEKWETRGAKRNSEERGKRKTQKTLLALGKGVKSLFNKSRPSQP